MDNRYRDIFARYILSLTGLSGQQNPKAALIIRGGKQLSSAFSKSTGTEYDTSPIFEALLNSSEKLDSENVDSSIHIFCSYFPSNNEFIALYSSCIRTIYYMGDITDEKAVRFLNKCNNSFQIIKLEMEE